MYKSLWLFACAFKTNRDADERFRKKTQFKESERHFSVLVAGQMTCFIHLLTFALYIPVFAKHFGNALHLKTFTISHGASNTKVMGSIPR